MKMGTTLLVGFYGAGIAGIIASFLRATRARKYADADQGQTVFPIEQLIPEPSPNSLPGDIFGGMTCLYRFLCAEEQKELRLRGIGILKEHLANISSDLGKYIRERYGRDYPISEEDQNILQNIAICLRSFLLQIKQQNRRSELLFGYQMAVERLIYDINDYFKKPALREEIVIRIMRDKEDIYLSLYNRMRFDKAITEKFEEDFSGNPEKLTCRDDLDKYICMLDREWISNDYNLKNLRPDLVLPLITTRNMLRWCYLNWDQSGSDKKLSHIRNLLSDKHYRRLNFMGLLFDKVTVTKTCQDIFKTLDRKQDAADSASGIYSQQPVP